MLQLKALPAVGISVLPKPILRSSASAGDPTRVVSSSSRAGAAPSSFRPRRSPRSPPPPSAPPILGPLLRATDCAKQPLDRLLHLLPNHVADEGDEVRRSRHRQPPCSVGSLFHNRWPAVQHPGDLLPVLRKARRTARASRPGSPMAISFRRGAQGAPSAQTRASSMALVPGAGRRVP